MLYPSFKKLQSYMMQIHLALSIKPKTILEIGIGSGFVSSILQNYCDVITADINVKNKPDVVIDITEINNFSKFDDNSFDLIIICEVLEHVPYYIIDDILRELKRITKKYVLISIPNQKNFINLTLFKYGYERALFKPLLFLVNSFSKLLNSIGKTLSNIHFKIKKRKLSFIYNGQHYWELGINGYTEKNIETLFQKYFIIKRKGRLRENLYHHFYLMRK